VGKSDPAQLILDESAGTADFSSDAVTTATFTDTKVFWKVDSQDTFYPYYYYQRYYDLSRLTGLLTLRVSKGTGDTNGNVIWVGAGGTTYNCKIGVEKKMF
jgi:hypothetical protein